MFYGDLPSWSREQLIVADDNAGDVVSRGGGGGGSGDATNQPQPTFLNGLTHAAEIGYPPSGWVVAADGYWYPAIVPASGSTSVPSGSTASGSSASGSNEQPLEQPYTPIPSSLQIFVRINVGAAPKTVATYLPTKMAVYPPVPTFASTPKPVPTTLRIIPIALKLKERMMMAVRKLLNGKIEDFYDESRSLKTVLNFGNDYQSLITNWMYDPADETKQSILVKLYRPLPDDVDDKTPLWISRELSPPVIDRLYTKFTPPPPPKVYLRPANRSIQLTGRNGASIENATMSNLLSPSASNVIRPSDPVLENWFTDDVNSVELNINYGDYREFVFFGSARARLDAFVQKLKTLEDYEHLISFNSASRAGTGSAVITGSLTYSALQNIAEKRVDLLRTFDGYERFLYYGSGSAYSASFGNDFQDEFHFNEDATWPKINGVVAPIASASVWYALQSSIADAYDAQNANALSNNLPGYLKSDEESTEFVTFLNLTGHQFDILKTYIDHMTKIYNRSSNPTEGMSPDMVWNIASALGIELPNQYAVQNLVDYTVGTGNKEVYKNAAAETWKRFLHNQIHLMKTKGTKASLRGLANTYGILPTTLQIRESGTPGFGYSSASFETYEEQTNALVVSSGSFIEVPWWSGGGNLSRTVEIRFATTNNKTSSSLFVGGNLWALGLVPITGSYGKLVMWDSGSVIKVSSSAFPVYDGDFTHATLRWTTSSISLTAIRTERSSVVYQSNASSDASISAAWLTPGQTTIGSSGSTFAAPFAGLIDEFRSYGEILNDDVLKLHALHPGMYNGNSHTTPAAALWTRLSFSKAKNLGSSSVGDRYLPNESPYQRTVGANAVMATYKAGGFPNVTSTPYSMQNMIREVTRFTPTAGASQFTTNKITIANPATLVMLSGSSVPVLSTKNSIVPLQDKAERNLNTNTVGFYFSSTDAINDNIIRSLGNIDLQNLIGDPADQYKLNYSELTELSQLYWDTYAYNINTNSFVDFVRNLLGPLFKQAKQLVPARAHLLSGIVHEPHILERAKAIVAPPPQVDAGRYTNTKEMYNLEATAVTSHPEHLSAAQIEEVFTIKPEVTRHAKAVVEGTNVRFIATASVVTPRASYQPFSVTLTHPSINQPSATYQQFRATVATRSTSSLSAKSYVYDLVGSSTAYKVVATVFGASKTAMQNFGATGSALIPIIEPFTNFNTFDGRMFFDNPTGIIGVPTITKVRQTENVLTAKGSWTKGAIYSRNDYVTLTDSLGGVTEYVCITARSPFSSLLSPSGDPENWAQMRYVPVTVLSPRQAVIVSGSVTLVPTGSVLTPALGYRPQHFKFTRDVRKGTLRHQFLGCNQTIDTTPDGKPPVEILYTAGDTLVVNNPGEPVQPTNNQSGPILDVR